MGNRDVRSREKKKPKKKEVKLTPPPRATYRPTTPAAPQQPTSTEPSKP